MKPKLAIIGDGNVGTAIQAGAKRAGYEARTTGKDPEQVRKLGAWGDVIVLAVPFGERANAIKELGKVDGKTVVDVTNAMDDQGYAGDVRKSGAESVQEMAEGARVVKAFNTVFAQTMGTGMAAGETLTLFVADDDATAKGQVIDLGNAIGFTAIDAGPLQNARWLETLGYLNIQLGYAQKYGTDIGFRLVGVSRQETATVPTGRRR
ncbi:MAG TPA: NADPH-dependent F420 reductase [Candidatus Thermoplasmatota archaeon]|nr:NADPH-dependent F420 reductase [Candidatus Thermoplasmatota archaeon]